MVSVLQLQNIKILYLKFILLNWKLKKVSTEEI